MNEFQPGDAVDVVHGTFVGKTEIIASPAEAAAIYQKSGGEQAFFRSRPGLVFVAIEIFGRRVVVELETNQVSRSN